MTKLVEGDWPTTRTAALHKKIDSMFRALQKPFGEVISVNP